MPRTLESKRRRIIDSLTMFAVSLLSIGLLLYVGFGEAVRTYEQFQTETMIGQGQLVQDSLETYLRPGLPLRQFAGFNTLSEPILTSDPSVKSLVVIDNTNQTVFAFGDKTTGLIQEPSAENKFKSDVRRHGDITQVFLPLKNRFENVGYLVVTTNLATVHEEVVRRFVPLSAVGLLLAVAFMIFTFVLEPKLRTRGTTWLRSGFATAFVLVAIALVGTLVSLYSNGLQIKARSIATALSGRLDDAGALNLKLSDFDGIDDVLRDFKRLNPEVSNIAVVVDGKSLSHTDKSLIGKPWSSQSGADEITQSLTKADSTEKVDLKVEILRSGVYFQVLRATKNFAALFLASALFAGFFMELARVLQQRLAWGSAKKPAGSPDGGVLATSDDDGLATISLIKPVFFLAVFMDSLTYAFLPQITFASAHAFSSHEGFASLPFMLYYIFFAAALIPSSRYELRFGARTLITLGLVLSGVSYIGLTSYAYFPILALCRALAGLGQGILFIGVQSFVLQNSNQAHRTQSAGIIVFGFQAGTLAGMAIGSLLISQIGMVGVCELAAIVAGLTATYVVSVVPGKLMSSEQPVLRKGGNAFIESLRMLKDVQFFRSMAFIGVPAKSIMTGVVLFALPLLLSKQGYANEDIGQITMAYAACVLWASNIVSRRADQHGGIKNILFLGALLSAAGLLAMGAGGRIDVPFLSVATILAGVCLVGIAHGFINAPIVTHVSDAAISAELGATSVAATYRLLERAGHVLGPVIMGNILMFLGQDWSSIYWVAGGVAVLAVLFNRPDNADVSSELNPEYAK